MLRRLGSRDDKKIMMLLLTKGVERARLFLECGRTVQCFFEWECRMMMPTRWGMV